MTVVYLRSFIINYSFSMRKVIVTNAVVGCLGNKIRIAHNSKIDNNCIRSMSTVC